MTDCYCLWCGRSLKYGSTLKNLFYIDDVLCEKCRQSLSYKPKKIKLGEMEVRGLYVYEGLLRDMMIQYKELYDEALFPVFLWQNRKELMKKYKGYTVVPVPSSAARNRERGFFPVERMFGILGLPVADALYKTDDYQQKNIPKAAKGRIAEHLKLRDMELSDRLLLVDDIMTTGETITAAYNLLKENSKTVKVLICAYNKGFLGNS